MAKRPRVTKSMMDASTSANKTENGNARLNNGNPKATRLVGAYINAPGTVHSSALLASGAMGPPTKTRNLSTERSEARSYLPPHKRQFYHSHKFQPMSLEQVMSGPDSEDEADDEVAEFEDRQMLDDFVDVNDVENRFMHLWNSFVKKQRVVVDSHIPWACEAFAKFHKKELNNNSELAMCWRIFMVKLWKFGLLDPYTMNESNTILEEPDDCSSDTNNNDNNNNKKNGVDHPHTDNTNSVDDDIDLNNEDVMDKDDDEDINNNKDK